MLKLHKNIYFLKNRVVILPKSDIMNVKEDWRLLFKGREYDKDQENPTKNMPRMPRQMSRQIVNL